MGRSCWLWALLLWSNVAQAQVAVHSLYDERSRVPGVLIPFKVSAVAGTVRALSVATRTADAVECRAMLDPYRPDVFLVKCTAPTNVTLITRVINGTHPYEIIYGPVVIVELGDSLEVIEPEPPAEDPKILAGRQLFNAYCVNCHNPPTIKAGRTAQQIKSAVSTVSAMSDLGLVLKDTDYEKLAAYLGSL